MGFYISISILNMKDHRSSIRSDVMTIERQKTESKSPSHDVLTAALDYSRAGFRVFPLHSVDDQGHCSCGSTDCGSTGKHPRIYNGFKGATSDESQIIKWWNKFPNSNLGIRTGKGLLVLDVDEDEGEDSLYELQDKNGKLPDTWESLTGRGRHIYLLSPQDLYIKCSRSLIGHKLDVRCEGGYVIAPPSRHYLGNRYEWECSSHPEDISLAEAPEWLLQLACKRKRPKSNKKWSSTFKPVLHIGERNETLFKEACHLRDLGLAQDKTEHYIRLRNHCDCLPPLEGAEVETLLKSAYSYPKRNPWRKGLSKGSERVFQYILQKSLHKGHCKLSKEEIGEAVGLKKRQVFTCIRQLERQGLLRVQEHNGMESLYFPQTHAVPMQSLHKGGGVRTDSESPVQGTPLRVLK
jgi:hypothetical protein